MNGSVVQGELRSEESGFLDHDDEERDEDDDSRKASKPVDKGWAWVILIASWCNMFILLGTYRAFGVLFIEIQLRFDSSSSITALISSLLNATYSFTTLVVTTIGLRYFSERQCIVAGGVILSTAYILSAFVSSVAWLLVLIGCVSGVGNGFVYAPTIALLSQYFEKYRSLANCIALTGGSVGSLFVSAVFPALVEKYSFSGAVLMLAGINLQLLASGSLMRPTGFYANDTSFNAEVKVADADEDSTFQRNGRITDNGCKNNDSNQKLSKELMLINGEKEDTYRKEDRTGSLISIPMSPLSLRVLAARNRRIRTISELSKSSFVKSLGSHLSVLNNSNIGIFASTELSTASSLDLSSLRQSQDMQICEDDDDNRGFSSKGVCTKCGSVVDCGAMRKSTFLCYIPCGCLLIMLSSVPIFLPVFAKDNGISSQKCGLLVTAIGVTDVFSVILWGLFADKQYVAKNKIISFCAIVVGIVTYCSPIYKTFPAFLVFSVIFGMFGRLFVSMYPVMLVDFIGLENLRSAMGIASLVQTATLALVQPLIGVIRDSTGSYVPGMLFLATGIVLGGIGILSLPLVDKCEAKRNCRKMETNVD